VGGASLYYNYLSCYFQVWGDVGGGRLYYNYLILFDFQIGGGGVLACIIIIYCVISRFGYCGRC
jgi:hypothetical protein